MPGTSVEEMELVQRAREGDATAFARIVVRYQDRIYNLAFRMLGNEADAADAAQEAFVAAWEGLGRFRGESALYTWLYRVAMNKTLGLRRRRQARREVSSNAEEVLMETAADCRETPPEVADAHEREAIVQEAIDALPDDLRSVAVLRDIEGLEYEQIAEVLSIALGTVKSRLHRARLVLRGSLARLLGASP